MRASIQKIHQLIQKQIGLSLEAVDWAPTPKRELGDFAIPCFKLAKELKKAPDVLANELALSLKDEVLNAEFKEIRAVGPYLNVFQKMDSVFESHWSVLQKNPSSFGSQSLGQGKTVVIDFSSPNVAKEIGLHHLRSTAIGNSLARIFAHQGYKVERINYLGDWGTSFGKLILGLKMFGSEAELQSGGLAYMLDLYVQFNKAEKENSELSKQAKTAFQELEAGNAEYRRIWKLFRDISVEQFKELYSRLGIDFDHYDGESLYESKLETAIQEVSQKIGTRISDGALVCDLPGHDIPILLKKDDGASLYITRDLAAIEDRYQRFQFDVALYVVAIQQKLHFKQLFDLIAALGKSYASRVEHISFGMLAFGSKTMKSREGNTIFLKDALDEGKERALALIREKSPDLKNAEEVADVIGTGALIFSDLSQNRNHTINFEWDKALSFEGDTAPFIQYTHARCTSLLEKTAEHLATLTQSNAAEAQKLFDHEAVRNLILSWDSFDLYAEKALLGRDPSQIATATLELAKAFNQLYHQVRFMKVNNKNELQILRQLTEGTQKILALGLSLLGIRAPQRM
jgi:arginyl-tRNA synthetase